MQPTKIPSFSELVEKVASGAMTESAILHHYYWRPKQSEEAPTKQSVLERILAKIKQRTIPD